MLCAFRVCFDSQSFARIFMRGAQPSISKTSKTEAPMILYNEEELKIKTDAAITIQYAYRRLIYKRSQKMRIAFLVIKENMYIKSLQNIVRQVKTLNKIKDTIRINLVN